MYSSITSVTDQIPSTVGSESPQVNELGHNSSKLECTNMFVIIDTQNDVFSMY